MELGPNASAPLLDLVEEHAFGPPFNEKGSEVWKKHGAFTLQNVLAGSALSLAARAGLDDDDLRRVQGLLARRLQLDGEIDGTTSLIAVGLARILHEHAPARFPQAQKSPKTNRLENPAPFLSTNP